MRRITVWSLFVLVSLSLLGQEERFYTFHSDIRIDTSGVISVQEIIRIYASGDLFKRGITRSLSLSRTDADGKEVEVGYDIKNIYKDDVPVQFFTKKEEGVLTIYVGEKDVFLPPGFYTYRIEYETPGQIGFFDGYDELSWNINGESTGPYDKVSANIYLPPKAEVISHTCYCGFFGSDDDDCRTEVKGDSALYVEVTELEPHMLLTIYVGFTKGVVSQQIPAAYLPSAPVTAFDKKGIPLLGVLLMLLLLPYYLFTWLRYGIDHSKPVVVPQFNPPANLSPAAVGMLIEERFDNDLITGSLVNLAIKGFIEIREKEEAGGIFGLRKDRYYVLRKLKEGNETLPQEENIIMSSMFKADNEITITGKYSSDIANVMRSFRENLTQQYTPILNEGNNPKFHILPIILIVLYVLSLLYFGRFEPPHHRYVFLISTFLSFFALNFLYSIINGIFTKTKFNWFIMVLGGAFAMGALTLVLFYHKGDNLSHNVLGFAIGYPLILLSLLIYIHLIKQPGKQKLHYQSQIKGLKMYIDTAEEKRLQFFNPPQVTPQIFETLLPYAIALNMGEVWGKKFENTFLSSMQLPEDYKPTWYSGSATNPSTFGRTLNSTLSNTFSHSATHPSDYSSGGGNWSSGSFGGGSSGGGGGGGSVGGW